MIKFKHFFAPILRPVLIAFFDAIILELKKKYPNHSDISINFMFLALQGLRESIVNKFLTK